MYYADEKKKDCEEPNHVFLTMLPDPSCFITFKAKPRSIKEAERDQILKGDTHQSPACVILTILCVKSAKSEIL